MNTTATTQEAIRAMPTIQNMLLVYSPAVERANPLGMKPMAVTSVSFPLNVSVAFENLKKLSLTEDTDFDGQATISVVYL